jgi:hypothetical protein
MTDQNLENAPNPQLPLPGFGQWLLFVLMLAWFAATPILIGLTTALLPLPETGAVSRLFFALLLAILLVLPTAALTALARWRNWTGFIPFALALLVSALYMGAAALLRAMSEPDSGMQAILYALALTPLALLLGGAGLLRAGVPKWMLAHAFGFDRPSLAGMLAALAAVAAVTLGWPLSGALGDSWDSQMVLLRAFALNLPDIVLFFGAVLGITTFNFQHKKPLAALAALFIYLAASLSRIVPHGDWWQLLAPIALLPPALLIIELRAFSGSIWPGLLFAVAYHAAPPLFSDPRDELPLITQPWQSAAHLWMLGATVASTLLLWASRQFLATRWKLSGPMTAAAAAFFLWIIWAGLWLTVGYPGFHNDGFIIILAEQADLSGAEALADPLARREFVRQRLIETARRTQPPITTALDAAGLSYRLFYITNMIQVDAGHRRMGGFAALPGVDRVLRNPNVRPYPITFKLPYGSTVQAGQGVGWNIDQVNADDVWARGVTGQGIVIAGQDTGYDWQHPALAGRYRGRDGDHAFNWHDAWDAAAAPFDDDQHGTHTMGTMLGDDGNGNQIGVAPGAEWIGCRNMRRGIGNPAGYTDCMEFFLAPYPVGGDPITDGDVSQAPHVINNSWGCPDREGCDDSVLQPATAALRAAGIMMVVSAGNEGPACETVAEPPAIYDDVFSVGATDGIGHITGFSSRGPVPGSSELVKPDIAAPGARIRSSIPGGGYGLADGTSMAGPHVAGLVALLWSANPALIGQIDATEEIIRRSAHPTAVSGACSIDAVPDLPLADEFAAVSELAPCACGAVSGVPNNVFGWGEINAKRAVQLAQAYSP